MSSATSLPDELFQTVEKLFRSPRDMSLDMPRLPNELELLGQPRTAPSVPRCAPCGLQREAMMHVPVLMRPAAAAILLIGAGLLCAPAANAQAQPPSPGLSDQSSIPEQKLNAAAAAIERVGTLKQDYQQRIAVAAPADKERI